MIKKAIYILVLLVLLIALMMQQAPTESKQDLPTLPRIVWTDVLSFEILRQQKVLLHAKKEGNNWLLVNEDAMQKLDANLIEQLLVSVQDMTPKRVASFKAEHHARFSVAQSDTLLILRDESGETLLSVYVGKPATDLMSTYIRLADKDTVVTVDKTLTWQVNRTKDAWLLKEETAE